MFFESQLEACGVDYEDPAIQSRKCYEVCRKHNKPVLVMEPVKGGSLVHLPEDAAAILENLHGGSAASYAIRFAASFDGMMMVLSGMSNPEQMQDNISFMKEFKPLDDREKEAVRKVAEVFHSKHMIPCTACRYCVEGCPKHISIPDLFACIKCGKCEKVCPQHLQIHNLLEEVAGEFEKLAERI